MPDVRRGPRATMNQQPQSWYPRVSRRALEGSRGSQKGLHKDSKPKKLKKVAMQKNKGLQNPHVAKPPCPVT